MFHQFVVWLANTVGQWGYPGIVMLMALESSFFPFPSEVVIPPAAYLAAGGKMNIFAFCAATVLGAGIWMVVLAAMGYWFGRNEQLVLQNLHWITLALAGGCAILMSIYWRRWKRRSPRP